MAPADTLFNATIVLVPIWLGVARYLISESEFEASHVANAVGLGMVVVLLGILYAMWAAIEQLMTTTPELSSGLYAIFATISLTGVGGLLFVINEIDHISGYIVTGIPAGIAMMGVIFVSISTLANQLLPQPTIESYLEILTILSTILSALFALFSAYKEIQLTQRKANR